MDTSEAVQIVVCQGKSNPLSSFYPCDLKVFGVHHKSADHAYQLTKAIRAEAANKVQEAALGVLILIRKHSGIEILKSLQISRWSETVDEYQIQR